MQHLGQDLLLLRCYINKLDLDLDLDLDLMFFSVHRSTAGVCHVVYAAFCFNTWKTNVVIFNG